MGGFIPTTLSLKPSPALVLLRWGSLVEARGHLEAALSQRTRAGLDKGLYGGAPWMNAALGRPKAKPAPFVYTPWCRVHEEQSLCVHSPSLLPWL